MIKIKNIYNAKYKNIYTALLKQNKIQPKPEPEPKKDKKQYKALTAILKAIK